MSHSRSLVPVTLAVPGVNLGAYITNVNQVAILSSDEERELAERYFYDEDLETISNNTKDSDFKISNEEKENFGFFDDMPEINPNC